MGRSEDRQCGGDTAPAVLVNLRLRSAASCAGSASAITDGAAALVIASDVGVAKHGLKPIARVVGWAVAGVPPSEMGIGPVPAIRKLLAKTGISLAEVDLIEVGMLGTGGLVVCLQPPPRTPPPPRLSRSTRPLQRSTCRSRRSSACHGESGATLARVRSLARRVTCLAASPRCSDKTNVNGGAIALGHPLGASGARITAHLAHRLVATGKRYGIGSACIGGGQGIAILIENVAK